MEILHFKLELLFFLFLGYFDSLTLFTSTLDATSRNDCRSESWKETQSACYLLLPSNKNRHTPNLNSKQEVRYRGPEMKKKRTKSKSQFYSYTSTMSVVNIIYPTIELPLGSKKSRVLGYIMISRPINKFDCDFRSQKPLRSEVSLWIFKSLDKSNGIIETTASRLVWMHITKGMMMWNLTLLERHLEVRTVKVTLTRSRYPNTNNVSLK